MPRPLPRSERDSGDPLSDRQQQPSGRRHNHRWGRGPEGELILNPSCVPAGSGAFMRDWALLALLIIMGITNIHQSLRLNRLEAAAAPAAEEVK